MAGIGFQLVRLLKQNTYQGALRAYTLSTVISSGTMLFTLLSIGFICFFSLFTVPNATTVHEFLAVIINLYAGSMILSALLQYTFFRFIADLVFLKAFERITPNFVGVLLVQLVLSCLVVTPIVYHYFSSYGILLQILLIANFSVLSLIWIAIVLLSGFKSFRKIGFAFFVGYSLLLIGHFLFEQHNRLVALLIEYLAAQVIILGSMIYALIESYPTKLLIRFEFLKKANVYPYLIFANFFFNLGFWIDKYLFWFSPSTSSIVFSPLAYSPVYDVPMFLSMLSIIPATSVFTLKIESSFAVAYPRMMESIFSHKSLSEIELACQDIVVSGRDTFVSALKVQIYVVILLCFVIPYFTTQRHDSSIYLAITFTLIIGGALYFMLWSMMSLFYYMTKYREAFCVSLFFCLTNAGFTALSIYGGPEYYGYGYTLSLVLTVCMALVLLNKNFKEILYFTFMMTD